MHDHSNNTFITKTITGSCKAQYYDTVKPDAFVSMKCSGILRAVQLHKSCIPKNIKSQLLNTKYTTLNFCNTKKSFLQWKYLPVSFTYHWSFCFYNRVTFNLTIDWVVWQWFYHLYQQKTVFYTWVLTDNYRKMPCLWTIHKNMTQKFEPFLLKQKNQLKDHVTEPLIKYTCNSIGKH